MTKLQKFTLADKINQLKQYIKALRALQAKVDRKKFFSEEAVRRIIERYLQLAIEAVLDIADQIIAEECLKKPEEYRQSILFLGEAKILPKGFAFKFSAAAGFRNILVHDYLKIDNDKVFQHFKKDAGDIEKFIKYILQYLKCK